MSEDIEKRRKRQREYNKRKRLERQSPIRAYRAVQTLNLLLTSDMFEYCDWQLKAKGKNGGLYITYVRHGVPIYETERERYAAIDWASKVLEALMQMEVVYEEWKEQNERLVRN